MRMNVGLMALLLTFSVKAFATGFVTKPWVGEKFIFTTNDLDYPSAYKVSMDANLEGELTTTNGASPIRVKQVGENLELILTTKDISSKSSTFRFDDTIGSTKTIELVHTLVKVELFGDDTAMTATPTHEICEYEIDDSGNRTALGCREQVFTERTIEGQMQTTLKGRKLKLKAGDRLVLQ